MVKDIILDDYADLKIENGDFIVSESDNQHIELIVNTFVGSWKKYPTLGVGIIQYLASGGQSQVLKRNINIQLTSDGYTNINVLLSTNSDSSFSYAVDAERI